ncbi:MAG: PEP-CTERM sorting domain-containing protein [Betaproteobacteria bacterium]|nr:PEP-CTERM sorting domain-containing protein [Betaproteobacteria bacterium]
MRKFLSAAVTALALSSVSGPAGAGLLGHTVTCAGGGASPYYGLACSQASAVVGPGVEFNLGGNMSIDFDDTGFLFTAAFTIAGLSPSFQFEDLTQEFAAVQVTVVTPSVPPNVPPFNVVDGILGFPPIDILYSGSWRGDITLSAPVPSVPEPGALALVALAAGAGGLSVRRRRV